MRYRLILTTVLLIAGGCTRPLCQKRDLVLERQALDLPVMHVADKYRVGEKGYLEFGTGFALSPERGITVQHDLPQEVKTLLVEREKVEIKERSAVQENWWDDWLTFSLPGETSVPRIDPNVDLPPGTHFVVVGFPDCGINRKATSKEIMEGYLSCEKRILHYKVVRQPFFHRIPEIVLARTRDPVMEGYSGSPAMVRDPKTGECKVFGILVNAGATFPFSGTLLESLFSWKVDVIRRIPEHLIERK